MYLNDIRAISDVIGPYIATLQSLTSEHLDDSDAAKARRLRQDLISADQSVCNALSDAQAFLTEHGCAPELFSS